MNKELVLRTFGYLIGHYKTHNETTINKQEIEAIEFMLKNNEDLEQQVKKQKEVIDRTINAIDLVIELIKQQPTEDDRWILDRLNGFKIILEDKEV